jgi:YVTN family beta-propeller protein
MAGVLLASLVALALAPAAQAATSTNAWLAKVGSSGANGTAAVNAFTTGVGNVVLKLKKLPTSRTLAVTLLKTSCKGSSLMTLASVKTTSTGAATKTISLTKTQVTAIKKAGTGTAKFAIRIGTGTTAKCGVFVVQLVPVYIAGSVTVGPAPSGIAIDTNGVWVTNWWDNTLSRINPATNTVLSIVPVAAPITEGLEAITSGGGALWITTTEFDDTGEVILAGSVLRVDPVSGALLATIPTGAGAFDIAYGHGAVWIPNVSDGTVQRIDPATNSVVAMIPVLGAFGIGLDATTVWVVDLAGKVSRIDPLTNTVTTSIFTQATGADIVATTGAVWVSHYGTTTTPNGSISRIDPTTNLVVANIPLTGSPERLGVAGGSIWVGTHNPGTVVRINAMTNAVLSKVTVVAGVYTLAATTGAIWAVHNLPIPEGGTAPPNGTVTRVGY